MLQYILELDGTALLFIQEYVRMEWLNPIVLFFTSLGNAGAVWIVLAAALLIQKKYQKAGLAMAISLLLGFLVHAGGWSFPSGHSTSSMAAALAMFCRTPRRIGTPPLVLAAIICLSRLYVGVHYPTDVLCGTLIGALAAVCSLRITKERNGNDKVAA